MPFMKERTAATYAKEILRNVSGAEIAENSVVDGTTVPLNGDGRRILETGTVMMWIGAPGSSKVRPVPGSVVAPNTNEVQTITRSATPDAGGYSVTVPSYGTTPVLNAYDAPTLQAAIRALHADLADATVGLVGQVLTVTIINQNIDPIVIATNTLTAAGAPVVLTVATSAEGSVIAAQIAGIVMHTTELWPGTTEANKDDPAVALFTKNCHFAADKLIGFTPNAAAVRAGMSGAGNDRCANCSFAV